VTPPPRLFALSLSRTLALSLFVAILIGGYRFEWIPYLLYAGNPPEEPGPYVGVDRRPLRVMTDGMPADQVEFLHEVGRHLKRGDRVVVAFAPPAHAYSYAYYRTLYILAPRPVLPPDPPGTGGFTANLNRATHLVTWDFDLQRPGFELVLRQSKGTLLRRSG
jgi:hypothetical protein